jgi:hypothetical protein
MLQVLFCWQQMAIKILSERYSSKWRPHWGRHVAVLYREKINNLGVIKPGECSGDDKQRQDTTLKTGPLRQGADTNQNETIKQDFQHRFT